MGMEPIEWTMGRYLLRLLAYLYVAEQVRGLEPVEQELRRTMRAVLPVYRTPVEVSTFQQQIASVLHAYAAAGARMAEAVAHEHAPYDVSDRVVRLPEPVLERLIQLAGAAGDLEARLYLEAGQ